MKPVKRGIFCLLGVFLLLTLACPALRAQPAVTDSTDIIMVEGSQIAWNFFRLIGGNASKFSHYKGDFIKKLDTGTSVYKVNDLNETGVNNEYIIVQPDGSALYWGYITGDEAKLRKFFIAFTMGVCVYGKKNDIPLVSKLDLALSAGSVLVYNMMLNDVKVGTFTEDKSKKNINIFIGLLK